MNGINLAVILVLLVIILYSLCLRGIAEEVREGLVDYTNNPRYLSKTELDSLAWEQEKMLRDWMSHGKSKSSFSEAAYQAWKRQHIFFCIQNL